MTNETCTPGSFDRVEALAFLGALVEDPTTPLSWRAFHETIRGAKAYTFFGSFADVCDQLAALQREGYGVFVVVNTTKPNGHDDASVTDPRAAFVDGDGIQLPTEWQVKPTLVTKRDDTHWHAYWIFEAGEDIRRFREVQKRLIAWYGTDPQVINESRVMRVPGFLHQKNPLAPSMYRVVSHSPALSYTIDQVLAAHPAGGGRAAEAKADEPKPSLSADDDAPIPSGERNSQLASLAGSLRYIGLSSAEIASALQTVNRRRCRPPLDADEVSAIARSIARYDFEAADAAAARGQVQPEPVSTTIVARTHADRARERTTPPPAIIEGCLPVGGLGSIVALPGVGKTLVAIELARCVAAGAAFAGRETKRGRVLYVCPDAPASTERRMLAIAPETAGNILTVTDLPRRLPADLEPLRLLIAQENATHPGDPIALLVFDTWDASRTHAAGGYADQDANAEDVLSELRRLAGADGLAVVIVHHATRQDGGRARGTLVFDARCDWIASVEAAGPGLLLTTTKCRDGESGRMGGWGIESKVVGESTVPVLVAQSAAQTKELTSEARDLDVLRAIVRMHQAGEKVTVRGISEACSLGRGSQTTRPIARLRDRGLVAPDALEPTPDGVSAAATESALMTCTRDASAPGAGASDAPGCEWVGADDVKHCCEKMHPGAGAETPAQSAPASPSYTGEARVRADVSQSRPDRRTRLAAKPDDAAEDLFADEKPKPRKRGSL